MTVDIFDDGCRKCICKVDAAYCTSKLCIDYQSPETNPEDYCRTIVEKNEKNNSTLSDPAGNVSDNDYNIKYAYKPENKTDDDVNEDDNQNNKTNDSETTTSPDIEENNSTRNEYMKMKRNTAKDIISKLKKNAGNQRSSHSQKKTLSESFHVPKKLMKTKFIVLPPGEETVSANNKNQSLNFNATAFHVITNQSGKLPHIIKIIKMYDPNKTSEHDNPNLLEDSHDYDAEYDNELDSEQKNVTTLSNDNINRVRNQTNFPSTEEGKYTDNNTQENKLVLVDETDDRSDEEKVLENVHPVMKKLTETLTSDNLEPMMKPVEKTVSENLVSVVMNETNKPGNTSSLDQNQNSETATTHENEDKNKYSTDERKNRHLLEDRHNTQPVNKHANRQVHKNTEDMNRIAQNQQSNVSTPDDSNNWVSREITVSSRTVKIPNEKAMKNMHEMFPGDGPPLLELEEKDTHSLEDSVHGKHLPLKNPLKSVSFTHNDHGDSVLERLDELIKKIADIEHYLEVLKTRYFTCLRETPRRPPPPHPMMNRNQRLKKPPKGRLLTY
ncbi:unnamed protein product [Schistosoma turkestanicum]|nr:unnamed protein product [Schistosoma turkestanicum]